MNRLKQTYIPKQIPILSSIISLYLNGVIREFGYSNKSTQDFEPITYDFFENIKNLNQLEDTEAQFKKWVSLFWKKEIWYQISERRARLYANQISPLIKGKNFLDVGCGNGVIGNLISKFNNANCFSSDVMDYRLNKDNPFVVNSEKLPFRDSSFDSVLLCTVLHHAENPEKLVKEAMRVATKRIVIKESIYGVKRHSILPGVFTLNNFYNRLSIRGQFAYTCFIDWFYNRVLETGVNVPFNFKTHSQWVKFLKSTGNLSKIIDLGIDDNFGALYHKIYIVEK